MILGEVQAGEKGVDAMLNIAVLVSGGGTNLQALIDAQNRGEIPGGRIVRDRLPPDAGYALERAKKAGYPAAAPWYAAGITPTGL